MEKTRATSEAVLSQYHGHGENTTSHPDQNRFPHLLASRITVKNRTSWSHFDEDLKMLYSDQHRK